MYQADTIQAVWHLSGDGNRRQRLLNRRARKRYLNRFWLKTMHESKHFALFDQAAIYVIDQTSFLIKTSSYGPRHLRSLMKFYTTSPRFWSLLCHSVFHVQPLMLKSLTKSLNFLQPSKYDETSEMQHELHVTKVVIPEEGFGLCQSLFWYDTSYRFMSQAHFWQYVY